MYNTGLNEKEKEQLIIWLLTKGEMKIKDDKIVFHFYDNDLDLSNPFDSSAYLKKAFTNIINQSIMNRGE